MCGLPIAGIVVGAERMSQSPRMRWTRRNACVICAQVEGMKNWLQNCSWIYKTRQNPFKFRYLKFRHHAHATPGGRRAERCHPRLDAARGHAAPLVRRLVVAVGCRPAVERALQPDS